MASGKVASTITTSGIMSSAITKYLQKHEQVDNMPYFLYMYYLVAKENTMDYVVPWHGNKAVEETLPYVQDKKFRAILYERIMDDAIYSAGHSAILNEIKTLFDTVVALKKYAKFGIKKYLDKVKGRL